MFNRPAPHKARNIDSFALIIKILVPFLVFVLVWVQLHWLDKATDELGALPEKIRRVLDPKLPESYYRIPIMPLLSVSSVFHCEGINAQFLRPDGIPRSILASLAGYSACFGLTSHANALTTVSAVTPEPSRNGRRAEPELPEAASLGCDALIHWGGRRVCQNNLQGKLGDGSNSLRPCPPSE